jgi:hypothetical protein
MGLHQTRFPHNTEPTLTKKPHAGFKTLDQVRIGISNRANLQGSIHLVNCAKSKYARCLLIHSRSASSGGRGLRWDLADRDLQAGALDTQLQVGVMWVSGWETVEEVEVYGPNCLVYLGDCLKEAIKQAAVMN